VSDQCSGTETVIFRRRHPSSGLTVKAVSVPIKQVNTLGRFVEQLKKITAFPRNERGKQPDKKLVMKNIVIMLFIMAACTGTAMLLRYVGVNESNIVMIYLLGILLFSYLAGGYYYSFIASVLGVLLYNFFFTEPYYTFRAFNPDYPVTFVIMFIVGFVTSMLTIRIKQETFLSEERERSIEALYHLGRKLLAVKNKTELSEVSAEEIAQQFPCDIMIQFYDEKAKICSKYIKGNDVFSDDKELIVCHEAFQSGSPCGFGTGLYSEAKAFYQPVICSVGVLGVIGISLHDAQPLKKAQKDFLDAVTPQIAVVLEREMLYEKQEETKLQVQRERLRADMLRTISHDLRTPLTGIMGSASTMIDHYPSLGDDVKKEFLNNIYDDACWLNELVENTLNMTRFEEGQVKLNLAKEAAEEIVAEAIGQIKKRAFHHHITAKMPAELIMLEVDGILIKQVLINLLNNAVNYTPDGSEITIAVDYDENNFLFSVSDNGPGISEEDLPHIFERFYKRQDQTFHSRRGAGIGLSLCKSIIEAHGGLISVSNRQPHGTVVSFSIPSKEEKPDAAADLDHG